LHNAGNFIFFEEFMASPSFEVSCSWYDIKCDVELDFAGKALYKEKLHPNIEALLMLKEYLHDKCLFEQWTYLYVLHFNASLICTLVRNYYTGRTHWNEIIPNVYLGAIPLRYYNHGEQLKNLGIKRVISLVREKEFTHSYFFTPDFDWIEKDIKQIILPAKDNEPLEYSHFVRGVEYILECINNGLPVFAHCKGGVGRSASLITALLVVLYKYSVEEALAFVVSKRPQTNLQSSQIAAVHGFVSKYKPLKV